MSPLRGDNQAGMINCWPEAPFLSLSSSLKAWEGVRGGGAGCGGRRRAGLAWPPPQSPLQSSQCQSVGGRSSRGLHILHHLHLPASTHTVQSSPQSVFINSHYSELLQQDNHIKLISWMSVLSSPPLTLSALWLTAAVTELNISWFCSVRQNNILSSCFNGSSVLFMWRLKTTKKTGSLARH